MTGDFDYLVDKIHAAKFDDEPFRHIEIKDFLRPDHFKAVVSSREIDVGASGDTEELIDRLTEIGYKIISFPGSVTSKEAYLEWHKGGSTKKVHAATEAFGMVLRLSPPKDSLVEELDNFFRSDAFCDAVYGKFGLSQSVYKDIGLQKYLHGYEISPHPDIRKKAATWMLNANPGDGGKSHDFHTHYMKFKPEWSYIGEFWRNNPDTERCWVPWDWCKSEKRQPENNSIVLFSPSDDTMHAIRAYYDHLPYQRTQFYGNLWYESVPGLMYRPEFKSYQIKEGNQASARVRMRQTWLGTQLAKAKRRMEKS